MDITLGPVRQFANWPVKETGDLYEVGLMRDGQPWFQEFIWDEVTYRLFIPEGFRYDGTTMSRFTSFFIGLKVDGIQRPAVGLHDYLYFYEGDMPAGTFMKREGDAWVEAGMTLSRKFADHMFLKMMEALGVKSWRAGLAFGGVSLLGGLFWADQEKMPRQKFNS